MTAEAQRTSKALGVAAAILIVAVLLSRILGFLREAFIAGAFGATGSTDAFYAAFTIPDVLNYLVAGGTLSITFIPIYTRYLAAGKEEEGNRVFSIIATTMSLVVILGVVLLEVFTEPLATRYLHKLKPEDIALAVHLTRILLPAQLFFYVGGLVSATLFARHRFVAASLAPLIYNLGTIAGGALLGRRLGVASLAWGTLAGAIIGPFVLQVIAAMRAGLRYRPSFAIGHVDFKHWLLLSLPLMIGVQLITADDWIMRYFAAADVGAISCLSYARKLVMVPIAIAGQAVGQASMPFFARLYAEGKREELGRVVTRSARASAVISAIAAMGMIAVAVPLVEVLFRRGHFTETQVVPTARYLALFALAIPLWGTQGILSRAFYATGDTLTPMIAGTAVTIVSLPIYFAGYHFFGVNGLVIASSLGILLHTAALLIILPRRLDTCDRKDLIFGVLRGLLVGALAAAPAYLVASFLPAGKLHGFVLELVRLLVAGAVFSTVVGLLARPLKVEDASLLIEKLFGKGIDLIGRRFGRRLGRR